MSDFRQFLNEEVAFSCTIPPNHENHLHHGPPMDLTEGLKMYICGVEAISHKILAKYCLLRRMSDFGPILDEEVTFSRPSPPNHENHLHHDPPMDPRERLNRHIWGAEAVPCEITAENLSFADFRFRAPSAVYFLIS